MVFEVKIKIEKIDVTLIVVCPPDPWPGGAFPIIVQFVKRYQRYLTLSQQSLAAEICTEIFNPLTLLGLAP